MLLYVHTHVSRSSHPWTSYRSYRLGASTCWLGQFHSVWRWWLSTPCAAHPRRSWPVRETTKQTRVGGGVSWETKRIMWLGERQPIWDHAHELSLFGIDNTSNQCCLHFPQNTIQNNWFQLFFYFLFFCWVAITTAIHWSNWLCTDSSLHWLIESRLRQLLWYNYVVSTKVCHGRSTTSLSNAEIQKTNDHVPLYMLSVIHLSLKITWSDVNIVVCAYPLVDLHQDTIRLCGQGRGLHDVRVGHHVITDGKHSVHAMRLRGLQHSVQTQYWHKKLNSKAANMPQISRGTIP